MTESGGAQTSGGRRPRRRAVPPFGPFAKLHARAFFAGVGWLVLAIMSLVEAVFLAERFPMVFRHVFRHHADPVDTIKLFLLNSTQVFDLALATAVLIAVYLTVLRMRENRELLVLFAAGTGPLRLLALALAVAVLAQIGSLTVSGVLDPASRYAQRKILFDATFRALRSGINTGQFYRFPNRVAFAPAKPAPAAGHAAQTRGLFVYEQVKPDTFRVVTADHARLAGPDASGRVHLKLGGFSSRTFYTGPPPAAAPATAPPRELSRITVHASDLSQEMGMNQLMTFMPKGANNDELSIFDEIAAKPDPTSRQYKAEMRQLGERLSRSFLCLLAPLIALAALCLTTRTTNYFVLPLACMGLMSLNVTSEWLIRVIVPVSPLGAFGVPAMVTVLFAALLLAEIFRAQGKLAQPQLARP